MPCIRVVALVLVTAFAPALVAAESPMDVPRLIELHRAGIGDELIEVLAQREGIVPLGSDEVLALHEAGLSRALLGRLVEISHETVRIENRDGVTVISGEGPDASHEADHSSPESDPFAPPALPPAAVVTVAPVIQVEAPPEQVQAVENGYPVGATFGWSGGAVFLPARFGGSEPSAFGRTVVAFTDPACCAPVLAPVPVPVPVERTPPRMIPVRTSRGELWIPN